MSQEGQPKRTTRPRKVRLRPGLLTNDEPGLPDATQAEPSTFPASEPTGSKSARGRSARALRVDDLTKQPAMDPAPPPESRPPLPLRERLSMTKDILLIAATTLAGIWAMGTSYYQSIYVPAHEPALVTSEMTLTRTGERNGLVAVNARLTLKNRGRSARQIWGVALKAYGFKAVRSEIDKSGWSTPRVNATGFEAFRGVHESGLVPIAATLDAVTGSERSNIIEANGDVSYDFPFYADKLEYDGVRVKAFVLQSNKFLRAKPEWVEVRSNDEEAPLGTTDACRTDSDCKPFHLSFSRSLNLW
ncbi:MAG: hypothetical protein ACT4TC_08395 [Myxococcaceae bacterium]